MRFAAFGCATAIASRLFAAADPGDVVRAALQGFLDQPNYTWVVSETRGLPEEQGGDSMSAGGQHEKGGYTRVNFRSGPHIPRDEWPVSKPWPGYNDREDYMSDRWVYWTPDGWKTLQQLPVPDHGMPTARSGGSGTRTPLVTIPIASKRIVFNRRVGIRRPDHEIAIMLPNLDAVTQVNPGVFEASITPAGANAYFAVPGIGLLPISITTENATMQATFWIRNGTLQGYEFTVSGTRNVMGRRMPVSGVMKRELRDFGTTVISVPDEVRKMFGEETPNGAP